MYLSNIIINILLKKWENKKKLCCPWKHNKFPWQRKVFGWRMPNLSQEKNWKQQKYKMNSTKNECFKIRTFNHCYRAIYFSFSKLSMLQLVFWVSSRSSPKTVIILRTWHVDTWYTCHWSYENGFFYIHN